MSLIRLVDKLAFASADVALHLVIAACNWSTPMQYDDRSSTQKALQADIDAFLSHAARHDGPAEACSQCQRFARLIREGNANLEPVVAED